MPGKLILLSGPSGAGKSTIGKKLLENPDYNLSFSISACSRKMREGEVDGKDYYFLSIDEFKSRIDDNEFIEWEEVYPGHYYGTLKIEVQKHLSLGKNLLFDIDVMGALNIKRSYKENALAIFINPPSIESLEERLKSRKTETDEQIAKRLRKAKMEMNYARRFDHIVLNENLESAIADTEQLVEAFLK